VITADFVTIDLAGFSISGPGGAATTREILVPERGVAVGIAVRNGSISGFGNAVDLFVASGSPAATYTAGIVVGQGSTR